MFSTITPLTTTALLLLTPLSSAIPLLAPHQARAGGPAYSPIGPDCTVTYPITNNTAGLKPSSAAQSIYSAYFSTPQYTPSQQATNCFEQCHGFSGCVAALLAQQVPTPAGYYGTAGGDLMTACLFFNQTMTADDFVAAPEGQYVQEYSANIQCSGSD